MEFTVIPFTYFFLFHIVGDFYFQSDDLSEKKKNNNKVLFKHCIVYTTTFLIFISVISGVLNAIIYSLIILLTHFIIDKIKIETVNTNEFLWFIIDQFLHVLVLLVVSYFIFKDIRMPGLMIKCSFHIRILAGMLLCAKPASLLIGILLKNKKPEEVADKSNNGRLIGILEREIIFIFLISRQYSAASLVIAVKSIARYELLKKQEFAEYYLLGTLLSLLIVLLSGFTLLPQ